MTAFEGLVEGDFSAYTQEKWSSNAFNRQRQTVKERLRRLGQSALEPLGLSLNLGMSPEHPSQWNGRKVSEQWLFALLGSAEELRHAEWLADQERSLALLVADPLPEHKHLCLTLCIRESEVQAALILWKHANADRKNLAARLKDDADRGAFLSLASQLPEDLRWVTEDGQPTSAEEIAQAPAPFEVRWVIPRQDALALGAGLAERVSRVFGALLPLYQFAAWSVANDHAKLGTRLEEAAKAREEARRLEEEARLAEEKRKEEERAKEREAAKERAAELEREREFRRREEEARLEKEKEAARLAFEERRKASIEQEKKEAERRKLLQESAKKREEEQKPPPDHRPAPRPERPLRHEDRPRFEDRAPRPDQERTEAEHRPREPRRPPVPLTPAIPGSLRTGDRVQLLEGPFTGKIGVVQEIDHRREVKIVLGKMSVKASEATLAKF